jgi:8-oxo-dGTP diphosphatase
MDYSFARMEKSESEEKLAAGGVVIRRTEGAGCQTLIVHRPAYKDWSFPKGGVKAGETLEEAALREVREETGLDCRIIRKLTVSNYDYVTRKGQLRPKAVHYFLMEAMGDKIRFDGIEVDDARWVDVDDARSQLSYESDANLLALVAGR